MFSRSPALACAVAVADSICRRICPHKSGAQVAPTGGIVSSADCRATDRGCGSWVRLPDVPCADTVLPPVTVGYKPACATRGSPRAPAGTAPRPRRWSDSIRRSALRARSIAGRRKSPTICRDAYHLGLALFPSLRFLESRTAPGSLNAAPPAMATCPARRLHVFRADHASTRQDNCGGQPPRGSTSRMEALMRLLPDAVFLRDPGSMYSGQLIN